MKNFWISMRKFDANGFVVTDPAASGPTDLSKLAAAASFLAWPDDRAPLPSDGSVSKAAWVGDVLAEAQAGKGHDIVFLVHGYNNSVADAYRLHAQVRLALQQQNYPCTIISFDWPSGTNALAYLYDEHMAKLTAFALVSEGIQLFSDTFKPGCPTKLHVVAHSMGTYVVQLALEDALTTTLGHTGWSIGQVALLAADLASNSLVPEAAASGGLYKYASRITNYFNGNDEVLAISNAKRLGLAPRAGRVGVPIATPDKLIDVDCSDRYLQATTVDDIATHMPPDATVCHSWYFYDPRVMADLATVLAGKIDRNVIQNRIPKGLDWFSLNAT